MKILVFAHTPPPHHGQSFMVQQLLTALASKRISDSDSEPIECYHVNCRVSDGIEDIGSIRVGKLVKLFGYCITAVWFHFRYQIPNFYYVPASGTRSAVYRDWMVMVFCRPFFRNLVFHWHATGLSEWLDCGAHPLESFISKQLLRRHRLSLVLGEVFRPVVERFSPKQIEVVPNGIPDPCPTFDQDVLPRRLERHSVRKKLLMCEMAGAAEMNFAGPDPETFRVVYLSLCTREKGLFDTVDAVALANRTLEASGSAVRVHLTVAGKFWRDEDRSEFEQRIAKSDLNDGSRRCVVQYRGFLSGAEKELLLRESDCFCFPTYYGNEGHPISLLEAMAFGLPIITTRWKMLPELFPTQYFGLVDPRSPEQIASALCELLKDSPDDLLRKRFLAQFRDIHFAERIQRVLRQLN